MEENTTGTVEASEVSASGEEVNLPETSDNSSDVIAFTSDYSSELNSIINNQTKQIELLTEGNAILLEEVNGLSVIAQYQNYFFGIAIAVISVSLLWHILNKWFFRGV